MIERVIKRFPLLYHNFWVQGCPVADDIFVTLSAVLHEVIYELHLLWGIAVKIVLHLVTALRGLQPWYGLPCSNCPNTTVATDGMLARPPFPGTTRLKGIIDHLIQHFYYTI